MSLELNRIIAQASGPSGNHWVQRYPNGAFVFEEGQPPVAAYLLTQGLVKLVKYSPRSEPLTMEIIVPGGLFGLVAVMDQRPYPVSAQALQSAEALRIPAGDFESLMQSRPAFAREAYRQLGEHVRHAQMMRSLAKEPVEKRFAFLLTLLSSSIGRELKLRREDLAEMVGCTPETAVRVLNEFRRRQLISAGWKRISIVDPAGLLTLINA